MELAAANGLETGWPMADIDLAVQDMGIVFQNYEYTINQARKRKLLEHFDEI